MDRQLGTAEQMMDAWHPTSCTQHSHFKQYRLRGFIATLDVHIYFGALTAIVP